MISDALERELRIGAQAAYRLQRALDEAADALRLDRIGATVPRNEGAVRPVPIKNKNGPARATRSDSGRQKPSNPEEVF